MTLEEKYKYVAEYKEKKIKRVPLDMQRDEYKRLKYAADKAGMAVNAYIKDSLRKRMKRNGIPKAEDLKEKRKTFSHLLSQFRTPNVV